MKKIKKYLDILDSSNIFKNMKAIETLEQIVPTIIVCIFSYAMFSLFMSFAEYVGRNGL